MRKLILALLLAVPVLAQTTRTKQIVLRCTAASRLSVSGETIIYKDCDDGKTYLSRDGAAFAEVATGGVASTAVGVRVTNTTNTDLTNSTNTALTWDTEARDEDNFHSTVTNTDRLTTDTTGWHSIAGNITYLANGTGARQCGIQINGTTYVAYAFVPAASGFSTGITCTALVYLTAGDYAKLVAFQDSTGTLAVNAAFTSFSMVRY